MSGKGAPSWFGAPDFRMATAWRLRGSPTLPRTQAYDKRLLWRRGEATLPGLDLSPQQLFFLSYAQVGSCLRPPRFLRVT